MRSRDGSRSVAEALSLVSYRARGVAFGDGGDRPKTVLIEDKYYCGHCAHRKIADMSWEEEKQVSHEEVRGVPTISPLSCPDCAKPVDYALIEPFQELRRFLSPETKLTLNLRQCFELERVLEWYVKKPESGETVRNEMIAALSKDILAVAKNEYFGERERVPMKIVKAFLDKKERGPRKERWMFRGDDAIALGGSNYLQSCFNRRAKEWGELTAVLRRAEDFLFNRDAYHSGEQPVTERAGVISRMVGEYCTANEIPFYAVPFSILRAARFPVGKVGIADKIDTESPLRYDLLLEHGGKKLLVSSDDTGSFGSLVGPNCRTIDDAFEFLKPEEVKAAEAEGIDVVRQGDWFLIPRPDLEVVLARSWVNEKLYGNSKMRGFRLPHERGANVHIAHEGCECGGKIYVRGTLRHHKPATQVNGQLPKHRDVYGGMGAGHGMMNLEGAHLAVKNKSLGDFSPRGFFDSGRNNKLD